jgi:conjugal transfer/type IV secretion protein DotA/TraY
MDFFGDLPADTSGSLAVDFLRRIFGGKIFGAETLAEQSGVVTEVFMSFNVAVSAVAAFYFIYVLTTNIVATANEGKVFGDNAGWHGSLRLIAAAVLLVPVPQLGGWNTGQHLFGYGVTHAARAADDLWSTAVEAMTTGGLPVVSAAPPGAGELMTAIADAELCRAAYNQQVSQVESGTLKPVVLKHYNFIDSWGTRRPVETGEQADGYTWRYAIDDGTAAGGAPICGEITLSSPAAAMLGWREQILSGDGMAAGELYNIHVQHMNQFTTDISRTVYDVIRRAQITDARNREYLTNNNNGDGNPLRAAAAVYTDRLSRDVRAFLREENSDDLEQIEREMKAGSWLLAGAWGSVIASLAAVENGAVSAIPEKASGVTGDALDVIPISLSTDLYNVAQKELYYLIARATGGVQEPRAGFAVSRLDTNIARNQEEGEESSGFFSGVADKVRSVIAEKVTPNLESFNQTLNNITTDFYTSTSWVSPIYLIAEFGVMLIAAGLTVLTAGIIWPSASIALLAFGLLAAGGLILLLPLFPAVLWLWMVVTWLTKIAEALIAIPLWLIRHFDFGREEKWTSPENQRGYGLLLGILMRPILMVVGLVIASSMTIVASQIAIMTLSYALQSLMSMSSDPVSRAVMTALAALLLGVALLVLQYRVWHFVAEIPDRVVEWAGGAGAGGDDVRNTAAMLAVGSVAAGRMSSIGSAAGGAAKPVIDNVKSAFSRRGGIAAGDGTPPAAQQSGPALAAPPAPGAGAAGAAGGAAGAGGGTGGPGAGAGAAGAGAAGAGAAGGGAAGAGAAGGGDEDQAGGQSYTRSAGGGGDSALPTAYQSGKK